MEENTFYTSLDIRSVLPVDKRMYIDELTNANLVALFGSSGQYAISKAVLFDRSDNKFKYFTSSTVPNNNILNPANWAELTISSTGSFIEWAADQSYSRGATIYDPATIPSGIKFYIAKTTTTIGSNPYLTPSEWFEVGSGAALRQTSTLTIDTTSTEPTATISYTDISLPNLPSISVYGLFDVSGSNRWLTIYPEVVLNSTDNEIYLTFYGDLENSGLLNIASNVKVILV